MRLVQGGPQKVNGPKKVKKLDDDRKNGGLLGFVRNVVETWKCVL